MSGSALPQVFFTVDLYISRFLPQPLLSKPIETMLTQEVHRMLHESSSSVIALHNFIIPIRNVNKNCNDFGLVGIDLLTVFLIKSGM